MANSALTTRDRGFALVGRLNRWLIAGAIALSGGLSVAAANAFHGRTRGQGASASAVGQHSTSNGSSSNSSGGSSSNSGGGLQAPAQAPASAPASPSGGVVSGGS